MGVKGEGGGAQYWMKDYVVALLFLSNPVISMADEIRFVVFCRISPFL